VASANAATATESGGAAPGTPAWWAARPSTPERRGRGRPPRSIQRIVITAAELVDEVGAGALTMRLLAERLHTSTATLYRHVSGKEELMVLVVDRLLGDEAEPAIPPGDWRAMAREASLGFHRALSRHPNLLPLFVMQVPIGPNALALRERILATLVRSGFSERLAARAYTALAHYVIGFAVQQHAPGAPGPADAAALGAYYGGLDPERYPLTVAAADDLTAVPLEDEFLEGLDFILDGIDTSLGRGDRAADRV
jgi:AcrR family transcriptional regulator